MSITLNLKKKKKKRKEQADDYMECMDMKAGQ